MKTVLIDGSKLVTDIAGGISNYIANVFTHLSRFESEAGLSCKMHFAKAIPTRNVHVGQMKLGTSNTRVDRKGDYLRSMIFGSDLNCDLYHSTYMFIPPKSKRRVNLLTVYDMINLERSLNLRNKSREVMLRLAIRRADFHVCISHETRNRLLHYYPRLDKNKVFVVHLGVDRGFIEELAPVVPAVRPFILYVGQRRDYKNFDSLIAAMSQSKTLSEFELVCVGGGKFSPEEQSQITALKLDQKVKHTGYTSESDLKKLYQQAVALAYTSLAEGFGLPIIEAMACSCPVICGNFSSMKEVAGGKAILVDDFSAESLEAAIHTATKFTDAQKEDARQYAIGLTWEKTARETLRIYESIIN